jgi:hypothetical protein
MAYLPNHVELTVADALYDFEEVGELQARIDIVTAPADSSRPRVDLVVLGVEDGEPVEETYELRPPRRSGLGPLYAQAVMLSRYLANQGIPITTSAEIV